ncbi:hypothetical protein FE257_007354 [Aspergillus nanangensis]|uniref:AA1-like domain-containing protein n=1 Tax=Aspergillus nanangensis TaxID=2582783 RepID=A0AAD4GU76_ASPNN|nr:hypothetical protein FE257_007354 [Aspergillus nanangensis]
MKLSIATILLAAATSALAAPVADKRDGGFQISNLHARTALDNTMSFDLLDTNNPSGTVSEHCNMIWPSTSAPDQSATCGVAKYKLQFPDGFPSIGHFTMAIEREGADAIGGRAYFDENDGKWNCVDHPEDMVKKDCVLAGNYFIPL